MTEPLEPGTTRIHPSDDLLDREPEPRPNAHISDSAQCNAKRPGSLPKPDHRVRASHDARDERSKR